MNTVQKNNNITKKQVQELLENNQKKLGSISEKVNAINNTDNIFKSYKSS